MIWAACGYARCSSTRTRADSVSTVSSSCTATGRWMHDGTAVELTRDEMNGCTGDLDAAFERLTLSVDAWKRRQQGWVYVEYGVGKRFEQRCTNEAHESRQADQLDVPGLQLLRDLPIVSIARRRGPVIEHQRFDAGIGGARKPRGTRLVGDHDRNARAKTPVTHGVDERLKVAATP